MRRLDDLDALAGRAIAVARDDQPSIGPSQAFSKAAAICAEPLPAPMTIVRPFGFAGRCLRMVRSGIGGGDRPRSKMRGEEGLADRGGSLAASRLRSFRPAAGSASASSRRSKMIAERIDDDAMILALRQAGDGDHADDAGALDRDRKAAAGQHIVGHDRGPRPP